MAAMAIVALGASSCSDPLDVFDEFDTSDKTEDVGTGTNYEGLTSVTLDGVETYSSEDPTVNIVEGDSDDVTLTMCDILFADDLPAYDLVVSGITSYTTAGRYTLYTTTPTNLNGVLHTDVELNSVVVVIDDDAISITFDATYEGNTYNVTYNGEEK